MKNIKLITTIIKSSIEYLDAKNISNLIMFLPEEKRENALSIILGSMDYSVLPKELVTITSNSCSDIVILSAVSNFLSGTISVEISCKESVSRWYQSKEAVTMNKNDYNHCKTNKYCFEEKIVKDYKNTCNLSISDWNTGSVSIR